MSSGGSKKIIGRTQGWEEAGGEFYQESFPSDSEFDIFNRDPKKLATLLPSKKSRNAATIRARSDEKTLKRRMAATKYLDDTLPNQSSNANDVQISMLPDLSQNLSNEQSVWEEVMLIKTLSIPMAEKRHLKHKILNKPNLRLQGCAHFTWRKRKAWRKFKLKLGELFGKINTLLADTDSIQSRHGTGIIFYFITLKWLFLLNLIFGIIIVLFVFLPSYLYYPNENTDCDDDLNNSTRPIVIDVLHGTGFIECSWLFYGHYTNDTIFYTFDDSFQVAYSIPVAYLCITFAYFAVSFIILMKELSTSLRNQIIMCEGQNYSCSYILVHSWDFTMHSRAGKTARHTAVFTYITTLLNCRKLDMKPRPICTDRLKLLLIRTIINLTVLAILLVCTYSTYLLFEISVDQLHFFCNAFVCQLIIPVLPFLYVMCLSSVAPILFKYCSGFEKLQSDTVHKWNLIRSNVSHICILSAFLYHILTMPNTLDTCWETRIGQYIYAFLVVLCLYQIAITVFVDVPHAILVRNTTGCIKQLLGEVHFSAYYEMTHIVLLQSLNWIGTFYMPLLPLITSLIVFILFHLKKVMCLYVYAPNSHSIYLGSQLKLAYLIMLISFYVISVMAFIYLVVFLNPSRNCGPFMQAVPTILSLMENSIGSIPLYIQNILSVLISVKITLIIIVIISIVLHYYRTVCSIDRNMVNVLKNQLVLEGHDKQFLLERLSKFIHFQQETRHKMQSSNVANTHASN